MKVCILSMQKVPNFGSVLQSYALKKIIESFGVSVSFIDIKPNDEDNSLMGDRAYDFKSDSEGQTDFWGKVKKIDRFLINRIKIRKSMNNQNVMLDEFRKDYLSIDPIQNDDNYDLCVIGSDEVFNCMTKSKWGFTTQLFGNVRNAERVISYAASCGSTIFDEVPDKVACAIRSSFKRMEAVSVRDNNTYRFVKSLSDIEPVFNLDPVLIYDFKSEIEQLNTKILRNRPFCIVYSYYNRINSKKEIYAIKNFCKRHNFDIVAVGAPQFWINGFEVYTPFEVLKLFSEASFVITDTFHGTIMSYKYSKKYAVIPRESNNNKLSDLINRLSIGDHLSSVYDLEKIYEINNDTDHIILKEERHKTDEYLKKHLK